MVDIQTVSIAIASASVAAGIIYYAHDDNKLGSVKSDQAEMKQAFELGIKVSKCDIE